MMAALIFGVIAGAILVGFAWWVHEIHARGYTLEEWHATHFEGAPPPDEAIEKARRKYGG